MSIATTLRRPIALIACILACQAAPLTALAADRHFVMGTDGDETSFFGMWYRRIFGEAFRRLGMGLESVTIPAARLTAEMDQGTIDIQPARVSGYAETHPNQVRIAESVAQARLFLFSSNPSVAPSRLDDLSGTDWLVEYRRGVAVCENTLKPLVPAARLSDVTLTIQGLKKLRAGRTDLYCDFDLAIDTELLAPEFKGVAPPRKIMPLGAAVPFYPYLHKRHAELAPRLAETLRRMKAEGLIERYRQDIERELGAPPNLVPPSAR